MTNNWRTLSLKEAGVALIDCEHRTPPASTTGYPYIAIPQLKDGRLELSDARLITSEHLSEWTRKATPQANDVVLSRRCNPGETAFIPPELNCALGQNLVLLRADGVTVYPPYLRWMVRSKEWWTQVKRYLNVGAVFDSLRCADIPNFVLPIPPIDQQHAIAVILGSLDDKIELNRRMNQTLESIACKIFKAWFVDFEPVRAKVQGTWRSGCSLPGFPAHAYSLLPERFQDSTIGQIPNGWKLRSLYDSARYINGAAYRDFHFTEEAGALPIIKIAELKNGITAQTRFTNTELDPKYRIVDGDVLLSWSGNPDTSIGTFVWTGGPAWLNQHIFRVLAHRDEERFFVFYLLKHLRPTFAEIARNKQTTGLGHFTAQDMKRLLIVHPSDEALNAFNMLVGPIYKRWYSNLSETATITKLRDALLPKLTSGEIRVKTAEQLVESLA